MGMVIPIVMNNQDFIEFTPYNTIGLIFLIIWYLLTLIYSGTVIHAYNYSNLPNAMLTTDTVFFGATLVITSILNAQLHNRNEDNDAIEFITKFRALSIGISILIVVNISSYFTVGLLQAICIYYQVWSVPGLMFLYYTIFKNPQSDQNKINS